jgi:hypothetical protein
VTTLATKKGMLITMHISRFANVYTCSALKLCFTRRLSFGDMNRTWIHNYPSASLALDVESMYEILKENYEIILKIIFICPKCFFWLKETKNIFL